MKYLLDTHILVRWLQDERLLSREQRKIVRRAQLNPLHVADITLWEIAMLVELGKLKLDRPLRIWLEHAVAPPLVERVGISPAVAAEIATLPSSFHRDPADRILVATARVFGMKLLTSDQRIVEAQLVSTVE